MERPAFGQPPPVKRVWALRMWDRLRSWRRIRFTAAGVIYAGGTLLVGLAAFKTGNNLLYLLWGALLGSIVVSSWLSEQAIRKLDLSRRLPRGLFAGHPLRVRYEVKNGKGRLPSYALQIREGPSSPVAFVPLIPAGGSAQARWDAPPLPRGVYPLREVTVSTSFPFGLFVKSRDVPLADELVVWPRNDRPVPHAEPSGGWTRARAGIPPIHGAPRGEYRGLRPYRAGDDPRDIHWRTTARIGEPVVREYERGRGADSTWIWLDRRGAPGDAAEEAVERAASLATSWARETRRFGFHTQGTTIEPAAGAGHLERTLDALARLTFSPEAPPAVPPGPQDRCILITPETHSAPHSAPPVAPPLVSSLPHPTSAPLRTRRDDEPFRPVPPSRSPEP